MSPGQGQAMLSGHKGTFKNDGERALFSPQPCISTTYRQNRAVIGGGDV